MKLKNYQEDIVLNLINIVLKDHPDIEADKDFIHDVAAYTLNRIKPRYIMSERGFTRFASMQLFEDNEKNKDNLIEMMMIVNIAVEYLIDKFCSAVFFFQIREILFFKNFDHFG